MTPDLVYLVRDGLDNEELRYSLRSLDRYGGDMFGAVWVVGNALPDWLVGVKRVQVMQHANRVMDVHQKMRAVADCDEISDAFVCMNDDHFLMAPLTGWPGHYRGTLAEFKECNFTDGEPDSGWARCVVETADWVVSQGGSDLLYQTHRPLMHSRRLLRDALAAFPNGPAFDPVGLYPLTRATDVDVHARDCKIHLTADAWQLIEARDTPWLSSDDAAFEIGMIGGYIRGAFREPSRWEV